MPFAMRSFVTAGVVVLSAGVASVAPAPNTPGPGGDRVSFAPYRLIADSSPAAVPQNLLNMVLSIPAWEVQAMNRFADAMAATGSWQVWGPTNVLGFDEQDPPKLEALVDMAIPILPFSSALGQQFGWWAKANFPMNAGCAARPGACPDLVALQDVSLKVPTRQLYDGYQFPTVTNSFTGEPTSWSGAYVELDRTGAFGALNAYLTGPAAPVESVSANDFATAFGRVLRSVSDAFNPWVQNSEWFNEQQTGLAPVFRKLAPALCESCDPDKPYDNPWLYENYPLKPAPAASVVAAAAAETPDPVPSDSADPGKLPDLAGRAGAQAPAGPAAAPAPRRSHRPAHASASDTASGAASDSPGSARRAARSAAGSAR